jgi:hypothetical protein
MTRHFWLCAGVTLAMGHLLVASTIEEDWNNPPRDARVRAYWWWLNGNVTREAITRDLEEMKAKGFGGALICDADGSSQDGNERAPRGPTFFSAEWRELYKHTLREADRLGLEMSLNIQSGWNLGGPMVKPDDAPKKLVWTQTGATGPTNFTTRLSAPKGRDNFYRDLFVLAYPQKTGGGSPLPQRRPLQNQAQKALLAPLQPFSAPDSTPLFVEYPATPGEEDLHVEQVLDLSSKMAADGTFEWQVPEGHWQILRFGFTLNDHCRVSTCSQGWEGYAIDPFDAGVFQRYWEGVVEPLIADAGPLAGKALKYLHTDSWEVEVANWTPTLRKEFSRRRGYDLLPWLPVIAGLIVNSRDESNRFLNDFRRTMGDLAIANHYQLFRDGAYRHGLRIHPESGGPHAVPIDAQQCLGFDDAPMSEFWAWSWRHRVGDENRFFVKQPASAAHTYGRKLVLAEGFTTIGPHWQETLWDNLKPAFDHACAEGLNLLVWHAFVCSPAAMGLPGQQYFAGTHLNPNVTWWDKSRPFFDYINRSQALLQRGLPVVDVAYYYGSHVPNFARLRKSDPARIGAGYDYDVVTEEVVLNRMKAQGTRLVLPDGMSYQMLVLPERDAISLPVLRKVRQFVDAGATVLGSRPRKELSLSNYPAADRELSDLAERLWARDGRIVSDLTAREALRQKGVKPDFDFEAPGGLSLTYFHRQESGADIYFVANRTNQSFTAVCKFRVAAKAPEIWDAVTGHHEPARAYEESDGQTVLRLDFAPCGSWFVVFRAPGPAHLPAAEGNARQYERVTEVAGPWSVQFDPRWGGPGTVEFASLLCWTERPEPGIRYYSGTAVYTNTLVIPNLGGRAARRLWLDLGNVRELAEVRVNGKGCGITWAPPFRVDITRALQPGRNGLEIQVVNFWPNRIIGDAALPREQQLTRTNIRKLTAATKLMESGLLGPVSLVREK